MSSEAGKDYLTTPAQLFHSERLLLRDLAHKMTQTFSPTITIVNIGIREGGSLHCLRAGAPQAKLIGIDRDFHTTPIVGNPNAVLIEGNSTNPKIQSLICAPIHLLFVDGGHEKHTVSQDIAGYAPKIPPRGLVAFHDYYERHLPSGFGVRLAVDEWMSADRWPSCWKHHCSNRLTIVFERL